MPALTPGKCAVAVQAVLAGVQHLAVRSFSRVDGWDTPCISIKIGKVLFNIEDRDALNSLSHAVRHAEHLADHVFGELRRPAA